MTKRRKRKTTSSGTFTTLLEIVFGGIAGAAIAAVWLILKPVDVVDRPPRDTDEPPARHAIHYQPGKLGLVRESQVRVKEEAIVQQSEAEVSLSEPEINRWLAMRYGASSPTNVLGLGVEVRPEPPMVRLMGEEMQIGIVCSFAGYGTKKNLVLQTVGRFAQDSTDTIEFVPTRTYLGSCPLPQGVVSRFVLDVFLSGFALSDELTRAWTGARDVVLADGRVNLLLGSSARPPAPAYEPPPARAVASVAPMEPKVPAEAGEGGAEVAVAGDTVAPASPDAAEDAAVVPDDGESIEEPAEVEETPAQVPGSDEATEVPEAPEADDFETMTIEAGAEEEEPAEATPASGPEASN